MSPMSSSNELPQGIDFMPVLLAIVAAFVVLGSLEFMLSLPAAEHGLVLFEKACPIHAGW